MKKISTFLKKFTFLLFGVLSFTYSFGQSTIAGWSFNNKTANSGLSANSGVTTFTTSSSFYSGVGCSHGQEAVANSGWKTIGKAWETSAINTRGYISMVVSFKQASYTSGSNRGPTGFQFQYKVGTSGTWTDVGSAYSITATTGCTFTSVSRTLPTACDNQCEVYIRMKSTNAAVQPGTSGPGNRVVNLVIKGTRSTTVCATAGTPTITSSNNNICPGTSTTIMATGCPGGNASTKWKIYKGGCGTGSAIGTGSVTVSPLANTTYYARAEGGCLTTPGSCASVVVTASDNVLPIARTKKATTVLYLNTSGTARVYPNDIDSGSSDNCEIYTKTITSTSSFDYLAIGSTKTVTLTVTDRGGNSASSTSKVEVKDTTRPVLRTKNITVFLDASGNATISPSDVNNGTTDNGLLNSVMTLSKTSFNCSDEGANSVTFTASDIYSNTASKVVIVTVKQNNAPTISVCASTPNTIFANGSCQGTAPDLTGSVTGVAYCSNNVTITQSPAPGATLGSGNTTITLTATDASGNTATCTVIQTVIDTISPVVHLRNATVVLDSLGTATITVNDIDSASYDNCSIMSRTVTPSSFDCNDRGVNTVAFTATDLSGNSTSSTVTVLVTDTILPAIYSQNINVSLDAFGQATIVPGDLDTLVYDNCSLASYTVSPNTFDCDNVGPNTVTLTAVDVSGNSSSTTAIVTIVNTVPADTITENVCDGLVSPSGKYTWTTTGVYTDTIPSHYGCDSVITVNLTIDNPTATRSISVCNSYYISPSGKRWTSSGTYNDTIPNAIGCDSLLQLNLIFLSTSSIYDFSAIDSFMDRSGIVHYASGLYFDTLSTNSVGCDSVISVNLTINYSKIFVDVAATGSNNGLSWANAYTDFQDALDLRMSTGVDSILLAEGTYIPRQNSYGPSLFSRDNAFHLKDSNVSIIGGYDASVGTQTGGTTILSGKIGRLFTTQYYSHHVMITVGLTSATVIDGLTIQDGIGDGSGSYTYFGIAFFRRFGGGMYNSNSSPSITNTTFSGNEAQFGGGMYNESSSPSITNARFSDNEASNAGGGMYNSYSPTSITNTMFIGNKGSQYGGGMYNRYSSPTITNATFIGNEAYFSGGGIYNIFSSSPSISNSIFWDNERQYSTSAAGADIGNNSSSSSPTVTYCLTQQNSTYSTGTGIVNNQDPLFVNSADSDGADNVWMTADDGLRLKPTSPAVDAGRNDSIPTGITTDIIGSVRIQNTTVNMGSYEDTLTACQLGSMLPFAPGTYTSAYVDTNAGYNCYCDIFGNFLLALDTTGTGALITRDSVQLQIGTDLLTGYTTAGGIITNISGGVVFNRKWNVNPTTQPTSDVKVVYAFTDEVYQAVKDSLATMSTIVTSPSDLQMYKLTSSGAFADPHAPGTTGIVLASGGTPSTSSWKYAAHSNGTDHTAEYTVSSFSGGGGGGGANGGALPVELTYFTVEKQNENTALLNWQTASELNNEKFEIYRQIPGTLEFERIGEVTGAGNSNELENYEYIDDITELSGRICYRIKQVDYDGQFDYTEVRCISKLMDRQVLVYPNPATNILKIDLTDERELVSIEILTLNGQVVKQQQIETSTQINITDLPAGIYFVKGTREGRQLFVQKLVVQK